MRRVSHIRKRARAGSSTENNPTPPQQPNKEKLSAGFCGINTNAHFLYLGMHIYIYICNITGETNTYVVYCHHHHHRCANNKLCDATEISRVLASPVRQVSAGRLDAKSSAPQKHMRSTGQSMLYVLVLLRRKLSVSMRDSIFRENIVKSTCQRIRVMASEIAGHSGNWARYGLHRF